MPTALPLGRCVQHLYGFFQPLNVITQCLRTQWQRTLRCSPFGSIFVGPVEKVVGPPSWTSFKKQATALSTCGHLASPQALQRAVLSSMVAPRTEVQYLPWLQPN